MSECAGVKRVKKLQSEPEVLWSSTHLSCLSRFSPEANDCKRVIKVSTKWLHELKERPRARGQKRRVSEERKRQATRGSRKGSEE